MTKENFEKLLDNCCAKLTQEARTVGFTTAPQFENRVREVLSELCAFDKTYKIDFSPHAQAFPDGTRDLIKAYCRGFAGLCFSERRVYLALLFGNWS